MYENVDEADLHSEILSTFKEYECYYSEIYSRGEEDQSFLYGIGQWSEKDLKARKRQGRPALTLNQMLPFAHQVINDIKQSRPSIRVSPVDDSGDEDTAEVYQGIIRNIERQSKAEQAYDTAAMNSVGAGIGWIRITTDYCDPMSFDQEIFIDRVLDFQSVYLDPHATGLAGSDAEAGFVFEDISQDEFERRYPDADISSIGADKIGWKGKDTVRIAEHFYKTYKEIEIVLTDRGTITRAEADLLEEAGEVFEEQDTRKSKFPVIKHCVLNGSEILESSEWLGKYIPLVPVIGEEAWINGKREFYSLIHQAKDAQRMVNYWKTASTEFIALQQKAPYIGPIGSYKSYPDEWEAANNENLPFLEYDLVYDKNGNLVQPPQKQPPITGSPAMMQEAIAAADDVRSALGMYEASLGKQGNEVSGIALRHRQVYGDNSNFHFMDNLSASITQVGCILVDLIPKLYAKRKIARILGEDGTNDNIPINQPYKKDPETGKIRPVKEGEQYDGIYDLKAGKYDVVCDVGASYSSKRQEMADKLVEIYKANPKVMDLTGDIFFSVLDMPMGDEIAKRLKSQMPPELLGEDPQAAKLKAAAEMVGQLEEQLKNYEAALADKEKDKYFEQKSKAAELELERSKMLIQADKTKAEIAKIYSEIGQTTQSNDEVSLKVDALAAIVNEILNDIEEDVAMDEATAEPFKSAAMPKEGEPNE